MIGCTSGDGLTRATRGALQEAGLQPGEINYVCAHGTGTPQNDAIEVKVMQGCFPDGVPFSSIKALTGHTMGAASAIELILAIEGMRRDVLLPTLNHEPDPKMLRANIVGHKAIKLDHHRLLTNAFGFGGANVCLVVSG